MRIGFVTPWRVDDETAWSGMVKPMFEALAQRAEVIAVETGEEPDAWFDRVACRVLDRRAGRYLPGHGLATARRRAESLANRLQDFKVDVVLAVAASQDIAFLSLGPPVVSVTDASFAALQRAYPSYAAVNGFGSWQANKQDRLAANRTDSFVVPSHWAADALQQDLAVPKNQIAVAPFGPAIEPYDWRPRPPADVIRLLLVASDWERKGGDRLMAVQAARAAGTSLSLTVVGDHPVLPDWVKVYGGCRQAELASLYQTHDALLEPTIANAGAVTASDAASFGLPVIASDIGGLREVVVHGQTGFLISDWESAEFGSAVAELTQPDRWQVVSRQARARFETALNWQQWCRHTMRVLERVIAD